MFSDSRFFQYILLVICWIACIVGYVKELYSPEIVPIASMILVIGGIVVNKS